MKLPMRMGSGGERRGEDVRRVDRPDAGQLVVGAAGVLSALPLEKEENPAQLAAAGGLVEGVARVAVPNPIGKGLDPESSKLNDRLLMPSALVRLVIVFDPLVVPTGASCPTTS